MNSVSLMARSKNKAKELGVTANIVAQAYFFESILKRIAKSEFHGKFIIKGGFLLSSIFGLSARSTMDIDFKFQETDLTLEALQVIIEKILAIDLQDQIRYIIISYESIRDMDKYGGYRISLVAQLDNIRQPLDIDIAFGDPVTPSEIEYHYRSILTGDIISMDAYNLETIVAEKFQSIIEKGIGNSRSKDYYDLYILLTLKRSEIDPSILKEAIRKTFSYRNTPVNKAEFKRILADLSVNQEIISRWERYTKKHAFVGKLAFIEIIVVLRKLLTWGV